MPCAGDGTGRARIDPAPGPGLAPRTPGRNAARAMAAFDCVVVGAGIHGLCTAFWLRQRGSGRLLVVDQGAPGHCEGSSHGATRITRSSYDDPEMLQLVRRAHEEGWPAVELALGRSLRLPTPGVFFGPPEGPFGGYCRTTLASGARVERLPLAAARRQFPLLAFEDGDDVLLDHTAAVVLAAATMQGLRAWLAAAGVEFAWHTRATSLCATAAGAELWTDQGPVGARHVVLACGPWAGRLLPAAAPPVVVRQQVGYVDVDAPGPACSPGSFPVWARIGRTADEFVYGLPSIDDRGLKIAVHRTTGPGVDPDQPPPPADAAGLLALAAQRLRCRVHSLRATEHCLYTMAADHRFHVDTRTHPPVTTIAACSGHAFKFGPIVGRIAADAVADAAAGRG